MLKIYADAVKKMMARAETNPGDPLSWLFQWYTHGVKQPWQQPVSVNPYKQQEIGRIYMNASDPRRALATTMWDTCTHYGQPQRYFLPWHRMYVHYFEQIIRAVSGEDSFTLPYWDYTNVARHALPAEFTMPSDPDFKYLHRAQRRSNVNAGQPIDGGSPNTFLNLNDMSMATYLPSGALPGFCRNLDANLHGNVHTRVGLAGGPGVEDRGMAFVPTAANDPIFWLHHCNIDRIWASWNKAGGTNPSDSTFGVQPFTFADTSGQPVQKTVAEVLETQQLDYVYDSYLDRPPGSLPFPQLAAAAEVREFALHANSAESAGPVLLGATTVIVPLTPQVVPELRAPGRSETFAGQLEAALPNRQVYLTLDDIEARTEPGVTYDVYLDLPAGTSPDLAHPSYVGTVNFFAAVSHGEHADHVGGPGASVALLVTDAVRKLQHAGRLSDTPTVTLAPEGAFEPDSRPKIGRIALVSA